MTDAALAAARRAVQAQPRSGVARHNLAARLGDLGLHAEARDEARRAFSLGLDAPETWLVLGRALLGLGDGEGAEAAFRDALKRRPDYADVHRELAQSIWMRTAEREAALEALEAALRDAPDAVALLAVKATVLEFAGAPDAAAAALDRAIALVPGEPALRLAAAHVAGLLGRSEAAVAHAEAGARLAPGRVDAGAAVVTAWLGAGRAVEAADLAARLTALAPEDQMAWALQATAWRAAGDGRYRTLYAYDRLVRPYAVEAPDGWPDRGAWLRDLKGALEALHGERRGHPLSQSLRGGSQTPQNLRTAEHPAIRGFFSAIDAPIRAYMAAVRGGADPVARRLTGGYAMSGVWSVRLRGGGSHVDHVHGDGWISSAFYVDLPSTLDSEERQGWIRFGRPPFPTRPDLPAEHMVRPEPGTLVLFPSYLWHGTVPFHGDETRLTIAFDLVPA